MPFDYRPVEFLKDMRARRKMKSKYKYSEIKQIC